MKYQLCAVVVGFNVPALPWVESIPWMTWISVVVTVTLLGLVIQYSGLEWLKPAVVGGTLGILSSVCVVRHCVSVLVIYVASARLPTRG